MKKGEPMDKYTIKDLPKEFARQNQPLFLSGVRRVHGHSVATTWLQVNDEKPVDMWLRIVYVVAMAKPSGRTKAAPKPVKDETIRMRVSAEQKAAFVAAATGEGLELSQWLRQLALRASGLLGK